MRPQLTVAMLLEVNTVNYQLARNCRVLFDIKFTMNNYICEHCNVKPYDFTTSCLHIYTSIKINTLPTVYSLNILRIKDFADFVVLSQTVKTLNSKYLPKHAFSLRKALSPQKFILK